jgi:hypothetical protein
MPCFSPLFVGDRAWQDESGCEHAENKKAKIKELNQNLMATRAKARAHASRFPYKSTLYSFFRPLRTP